jgi:membrane-associated phospholipid phosphatase
MATGGAFALYLIEQDIRKIFIRNRSPFADSMGEVGDIYGEPITVVLLTGCIYGYALFFDNSRMRDTAVLMTASLVPAGFIQTVSKTAAGRARPSTDADNNIFKPFKRTEEYYSFVSGHTLVAMSISLVLARQVNSIPLKIGFYTFGILGGLSRIYNDDHWVSDVFLGAALSYACVNTAASWLENNQKNSAQSKNILLHVSPTTVSLSLLW